MGGHNILGQSVEYKSQYDASLLFPINRSDGRHSIGLSQQSLVFYGEDIWNAYELSWLNENGKPEVAIAEFRFAANTQNIIESKSFKLYLNSFNQTRIKSQAALEQILLKDLSAAAIGHVKVKLFSPSTWQSYQCETATGFVIDNQDIVVDCYHPDTRFLSTSAQPCSERLVSHLLRSLCPVTGQPDWASIMIEYSGQAIDHAGLLRYIVSYREHQDFHEQCVEKIFSDINSYCKPEQLTVYARYLRRGGLDICPFRSTQPNAAIHNLRLCRQ